MFRWYKKAAICYAYISDAATVDDFDKSRWFTRGWTLQELVAPPVMRFYSSSWDDLGTKIELKDVISRITAIDAEVLETGHLGHVTLARKMVRIIICLRPLYLLKSRFLYVEGINVTCRP